MKYDTSLKSFTLIEILIVVSIISILATTTLATFYGYANVRGIDREVGYIVSDINLARNKALSNAFDDNGTPAILTDDSVYWGLRFNCSSTKYSYELGYFDKSNVFRPKQEKLFPKNFTCSPSWQTLLKFIRGTGFLENPTGVSTITVKYGSSATRNIQIYLSGKIEVTSP